jgi:hypothetical protein
MRYPHTVTFESPTQARTPSGGVVLTWAEADDLVDLPARVIPVPLGEGDAQAERMVLDEDRFTIVIAGDRLVGRDMRAVTSHVAEPLQVTQVQRPVLYGSQATNATIVEVERIAADAGAGS